jgi:5'-3' exonuclease
MGIKYFFKWFKESFPKTVKKYDENFNRDSENNPLLLLLDLNGIIHTSCQKIYKYGSFEPKSLLKKSPPIFSGEKDVLVFEDVLNSINSLINTLDPEEIVLCIDGVAPVSKQIQQRQRRFLSKKTDGGFDSNCISPGTEFLYKLGLFLKSNIETKLEKEWLNVTTIYFMDSLVPGEGEHKLFDFLRSNKTKIQEKKFNIFIVGNDADLIMLSLLVSSLFLKENLMYILREDLTCKKFSYLMIDINQLKKNILSFAVQKPDFKATDFERLVCDFVILCFMVGNDFLPPIPLFNVYDGGLDLMMKYYFTNPIYITFRSSNSFFQIDFKSLIGVFDHILNTINPQAVQHYKTREYGYPNIILDISLQKKKLLTDITIHYLKAYALHHKINKNLITCYLQEINWVFNYYVYGSSTVDWKIYYPSQFAPSSLDLLNYLQTRQFKKSKVKLELLKETNFKIEPFFQLLCILPPHSSNLLPKCLGRVLVENLSCFHPKEIKIDYEGKINEWEGIPILPPLNYKKILSIYKSNIHLCSKEDLKRNKASHQLMISLV